MVDCPDRYICLPGSAWNMGFYLQPFRVSNLGFWHIKNGYGCARKEVVLPIFVWLVMQNAEIGWDGLVVVGLNYQCRTGKDQKRQCLIYALMWMLCGTLRPLAMFLWRRKGFGLAKSLWPQVPGRMVQQVSILGVAVLRLEVWNFCNVVNHNKPNFINHPQVITIVTQGLVNDPFWGFVHITKTNICWRSNILNIFGWCETLGHLPTPAKGFMNVCINHPKISQVVGDGIWWRLKVPQHRNGTSDIASKPVDSHIYLHKHCVYIYI